MVTLLLIGIGIGFGFCWLREKKNREAAQGELAKWITQYNEARAEFVSFKEQARSNVTATHPATNEDTNVEASED